MKWGGFDIILMFKDLSGAPVWAPDFKSTEQT